MAGDKNINIGVGADVSGLKTGMNEAAKMVQDAGNKMQTAAKDATAKTEASFSNLRQAYRATAKDAYEIALNQGTNSAAFLEATKRAGEFKDELDLVNTKIAAFSSDTPVLTSALGVGQGLAGAFSAATGAMALFGGASKEVEQALLKVQGAMALLQGLQAIGQLGDAMSAFASVIKVQVLPALMTMQGAIIATGIGALVIGVIALTQAASAYNDQIDREIDLKKQVNEQNKLYNEAVNKAAGANLKTEELKVRAMRDGTAKQLAELEVRKKQELQAEKATFEASNRTYYDENRLKDRTKFITDYYVQQAREVQNAVKKESQNTGGLVNAIMGSSTELSGKQGIMKGNLLGDLPEQLKVAQVSIDNFVSSGQAKMSTFTEAFTKSMLTIKEAIGTIALQAFGQLGTALGQSLAGVDTSLEKILGSIADTLGNTLLAIGAPMLAIPGTQGLGAAYMAGGFALKAVAGYLNAQGGKKPSSGGGSGGGSFSSGNTGFSGFTPQNNSMVLSTRLVGQDLLLSVEKSAKKMERVR